MYKLLLFIGLMCCFGLSYGQNISITFSAAGAASRVDSVMATNLATNRFITLPGDETLILGAKTGVTLVDDVIDGGQVFPNPFNGRTTYCLSVRNPQSICLKIQNLAGQVLAESEVFVPQGENQFILTIAHPGIYLISLKTEQGTQSCKAICNDDTGSGNTIQYAGVMPENLKNSSAFGVKGLKTSYALDYNMGDIVLYQCFGGIHTVVITDSPAVSKNYEVVFATCTDPDGNNYSTVRIGDQTWMAENLAYLPAVSPSTTGSATTPYFYVYDYDGSSVSDAKERFNYTRYGVLYNGVAAKTACPAGWRLPTDAEWMVLEKFLGMTESDAAVFGDRYSGDVGKKLKSSAGSWSDRGNGINSKGFSALPGGFRSTFGFFDSRTKTANFWTSTPFGLNNVSAYQRALGYVSNGITRDRLTCDWGYSIRCLNN